jgi:hypothetical protein
MTIKEWVSDHINSILDQIRPGDGEECSWLDMLISEEEEVVQQITYRYNNDDCWNSINESDKCRITSEIVDELENE